MIINNKYIFRRSISEKVLTIFNVSLGNAANFQKGGQGQFPAAYYVLRLAANLRLWPARMCRMTPSENLGMVLRPAESRRLD